jgi:hypothetical protein
LRPYFQDGYLAGTPDTTNDYETKSELDFTKRLIAKFAIPNEDQFWGQGLRGLSHAELYPPEDGMKELCDQIRIDEAILDQLPATEASVLGEFVATWAGIERLILRLAQRQEERIVSMPQAIRSLETQGWLAPWLAEEANRIRLLRNNVVHGHGFAPDVELRRAIASLTELRNHLKKEERERRRRS